MKKDFNSLVSRALKKLANKDVFFGQFMSNFQFEEEADIEDVDYYINDNGYVIVLVNPDIDTLDLVKELKHIALHLIKDPIPDVSPRSAFENVVANMAFDATTVYDENNCQITWHGLPINKSTDYYYKRMMDPDYAEEGEKTLRELDPKFVLELENLKNDPSAFDEQVHRHLYWLEVQKYSKEKLSEEILFIAKEAIVQISKNTVKSVGFAPAGLCEYFNFKKEPAKFNWGAMIRRHLGSNPSEDFKPTRRRESKRFKDGVGHAHKKNPAVLVLLDTSGSVSQKEFQEFFREIDTMARRGYDVTVAEIDGNIENVYPYKKGKTKIEVIGRGGTNLKAAVQYWNEHRKEFAAGVLFTDGWDNVNGADPKGNFMWVISSNGYQETVYPGKVLFIPKDNND